MLSKAVVFGDLTINQEYSNFNCIVQVNFSSFAPLGTKIAAAQFIYMISSLHSLSKENIVSNVILGEHDVFKR